MGRLICAFVVRIWHKTHFLMARLIWIHCTSIESDCATCRQMCVFIANIKHKRVVSWYGSIYLVLGSVMSILCWNKLSHRFDKTNKMTCAPSKDSDQPIVYWVYSEDWSVWVDDQSGLIWVFAGRTGHFVGFVMWCSNNCLLPDLQDCHKNV